MNSNTQQAQCKDTTSGAGSSLGFHLHPAFLQQKPFPTTRKISREKERGGENQSIDPFLC